MLVQTATKPKDRTAKGLIPDAEAGEEIMQGTRQICLDEPTHSIRVCQPPPHRQDGLPICLIGRRQPLGLLAAPIHDRRPPDITTSEQVFAKGNTR
ncbi:MULTISPECIES: hypothetical protein [Rhizobium/Agrobacterium group]|uniref:Uncharacterized protein n=4 Tax=Rhizobium/Agrobacterium group TaxID=227290 RepID=A0A2Z2PLU1_RHIRH|nr:MULTISPECIES: hypothetical protein [Rhizobium/Agrobacterium group]KAA6481566.1 hypothetical protein DXT98_28230 [Agrobacterium sp. ICMP 7243]ASK41066.1 hypothetical protein [Rhizobium rhizogenes]ASK41236.1 hypothetical protein [Agrobacterium tumefaciens]ASK44458.1 hypothetical protein [Agrobacterium tumefaciens]ASK46615.1 hypothetical protein [Rhizobium rhizogenes]